MSEHNIMPYFELPLIRCISSLYQALIHAFCHSNGLDFSNMTNRHNMLRKAILLDHHLFYGDLSRKTIGRMMVHLLSNATTEYMNYCYSRNMINQTPFVMTMVKCQTTEDMITTVFGVHGTLNKELGRLLRQWYASSIHPYPGARPLIVASNRSSTDVSSRNIVNHVSGSNVVTSTTGVAPNQSFTDLSSRDIVNLVPGTNLVTNTTDVAPNQSFTDLSSRDIVNLVPETNLVTNTTDVAPDQSSMDASNDKNTLTSESSSSISQTTSDDIDTTSPKVKKVSLKRRNSDSL